MNRKLCILCGYVQIRHGYWVYLKDLPAKEQTRLTRIESCVACEKKTTEIAQKINELKAQMRANHRAAIKGHPVLHRL